ncbi:MAG: hypothetical protein JSW28_10130 [Thermoplasmata archaeon]|nr:MAG: hypothetical protein JSW28_10130 [Thermoplasmata archaeon]
MKSSSIKIAENNAIIQLTPNIKNPVVTNTVAKIETTNEKITVKRAVSQAPSSRLHMQAAQYTYKKPMIMEGMDNINNAKLLISEKTGSVPLIKIRVK